MLMLRCMVAPNGVLRRRALKSRSMLVHGSRRRLNRQIAVRFGRLCRHGFHAANKLQQNRLKFFARRGPLWNQD